MLQVGDCAYVVTDVDAFNAAGGLHEAVEYEACEVCSPFSLYLLFQAYAEALGASGAQIPGGFCWRCPVFKQHSVEPPTRWAGHRAVCMVYDRWQGNAGLRPRLPVTLLLI